jgi:hypothetical protein
MLELLEKHPKAAEVVRNWFTDKMIESLNTDDVPEDFKEIIRQDVIDNERIDKILGSQPRALFDVFDENKIYIIIDKQPEWNWIIENESYENSICKSRKEAESFAIKAAFEILEQKLSSDEATVEV